MKCASTYIMKFALSFYFQTNLNNKNKNNYKEEKRKKKHVEPNKNALKRRKEISLKMILKCQN